MYGRPEHVCALSICIEISLQAGAGLVKVLLPETSVALAFKRYHAKTYMHEGYDYVHAIREGN